MVLSIIATAVVQAAVVGLAAWFSGAWWISGGVGFSRHYGAWAILVTDPLLLIASGFAHKQFRFAMATLPQCPSDNAGLKLRRLLREQMVLVRGEGYSALLFALIVVVGLYAWVVNLIHTYDPSATYHHQVFDSGKYLASYIAFKGCLFLSWVVVYPIIVYEFLSVAIATFVILRTARRTHLICPIAIHPDNCYGLGAVGTLNVAILAPFLLVFIAIFAVMATHDVLYDAILLPLGLVTVVFLATSVVVIWPVYSLLSSARDTVYHQLRKQQVPGGLRRDINPFQFAAERFHFNAASASPYSVTMRTTILAMRTFPPRRLRG
ncbi:MAG: hypothetical protein WDM81_07005 [Rhizomicrobium sp.]